MAYAGFENLGERAEDANEPRPKRMTRHIGVVVYKAFSLPSIELVPEVFQMANDMNQGGSSDGGFYRVRLYSADGGSVMSSSSIVVWTLGLQTIDASAFDALFIAGGKGAQDALRDGRVIDWLRAASPSSDVVRPIGEGRLLLRAAGLDKLQQPSIQTSSNQRRASAEDEHFNDADARFDSAKAALNFVKRDLGGDVARNIAGRLSLSGATTLVSLLSDARPTTSAEKVRESARWLQNNCQSQISVSDAVRVAAMSQRNFLRCFRREIGLTPSEFLCRVRLDMTSRLLAETDLPVDEIARRCGWISGERLVRIFQEQLKQTPSDYRMRRRTQIEGDRHSSA
jgi:transcriptional regulator GlxA family with amidase domain